MGTWPISPRAVENKEETGFITHAIYPISPNPQQSEPIPTYPLGSNCGPRWGSKFWLSSKYLVFFFSKILEGKASPNTQARNGAVQPHCTDSLWCRQIGECPSLLRIMWSPGRQSIQNGPQRYLKLAQGLALLPEITRIVEQQLDSTGSLYPAPLPSGWHLTLVLFNSTDSELRLPRQARRGENQFLYLTTLI